MLRIQQDSERLSKRRKLKMQDYEEIPTKSCFSSCQGRGRPAYLNNKKMGVARGRLASNDISTMSMGNESYGYLDKDENLPAWITNMYKDPFEVSLDADD